MSIKELLQSYVDGEITAIEAIRTLSGIFNKDQAPFLLALINNITRLEQKDLDKQTFRAVWELE